MKKTKVFGLLLATMLLITPLMSCQTKEAANLGGRRAPLTAEQQKLSDQLVAEGYDPLQRCPIDPDCEILGPHGH